MIDYLCNIFKFIDFEVQALAHILKKIYTSLTFCPMRAAFTFFPVKKSKQKSPVQKKAIA